MRPDKRLIKFLLLFSACWSSLPALSSEELALVPLSEEIAANKNPKKSSAKINDDGYTINYNTVSIIEYIRFASKICGVNFIFEEKDLNFTVTVVSEDPITPENVMATLVQILRIHDLLMLEQGNNIVIHQNSEVKQLATVVESKDQEKGAPIVTRIFRVANVRPESLVNIIKPMISSTALIDSSPETRQLILTDVTANVDKVAALIESIDSPHSPLNVGTYETVNNEPSYLIEITKQIMVPMAQGNTFLLVPAGLSNTIYVVSTPEVTAQAISMLKKLDMPAKRTSDRRIKSENIFTYQIKNRGGHEILSNLSKMANHLNKLTKSDSADEDDLVQTIDNATYFPDSNTVVFIGSKDSRDKITEFLAAFDTPHGSSYSKKGIYVYVPKNLDPSEVVTASKDLAKSETDPATKETFNSAVLGSAASSVIFKGEEGTFTSVIKDLDKLDTAAGSKNSYFVYVAVNYPARDILKALKLTAEPLKGSAEYATVNHGWVNDDANTITFKGDERALGKVKDLLTTVDTPASDHPTKPKNSFYIYKIKYSNYEDIKTSLKGFSSKLGDKEADTIGMPETIAEMKYIPISNSILFIGPETALKKVQEILPEFDTADGLPHSEFLVYKPKHVRGSKLVADIKANSSSLKGRLSDQEMNRTLDSVTWVPSTDSITATGSAASLKRIQDMLAASDTPNGGDAYTTVYITLHNTTDEAIEEGLEHWTKSLKDSNTIEDANFASVIQNISYSKESNSMILRGEKTAVDIVKSWIEQHDQIKPSTGKTSFLVYKPKYLTHTEIENKLNATGSGLKKAELSDPALLSTIRSMTYVDTTNTMIFTGTTESLDKIKEFLKEIDVSKSPPIHPMGKKSILLYKIKNSTGAQLIALITPATKQLGTQQGDQDLVSALKSVKYIQESNSLMFTGTAESLAEVEKFVSNLDVGGSAAPIPAGPTSFFIYKPKSMTGPELVAKLNHSTEGLKSAHLLNQPLFDAIANMKWIDETHSLIFTGSPAVLEEVKDLLKDVDVNDAPFNPSPSGSEIQSIDNTSFLVYKLQFHKGDEIQGALRQIAKDLTLSNAPVNQNLLNAINSIQWLEVTNSLLCSGSDDDTLKRLKELIKNLDIQLKQVFIEMLVIQTSMTNALNFGLEWGAKYKYKDKFAGTLNNLQQQTSNQSSSGSGINSTDLLNSALAAVNPLNTPGTNNNNAVPILGPGFDLGIIGEVIRHGGDTFLSIGSLVAALQTDAETTVVMTPKLITQDGRTSSIFQGNNIPFAGSFVSNTSGGTGSSGATVGTTNIEYRDIGTNLTITPVLGNSDVVTLDISLDQTQTAANATNSQINLNSNGIPTQINGIETSKTSMQTTVHVPNDHFLILSGMVQTSNAKTKSGIPCLGGLPLIGAAFSTDNNLVSSTNIVIFLRPHILSNSDQMDRITKDQERFFREQTGTPQLEQSYNEAMEFIKSSNDE